MNLRKLNRSIHRDLGYIFFAASLIYGLSGIALNHIKDWNPNYIVSNSTYTIELTDSIDISTQQIKEFLSSINESGAYKKHIPLSHNKTKVFIQNGTLIINKETGEASLEKIERRPIFYQFNFMHYNHAKRLWTWFADSFAVSLILLAVSGLFMVKGKKGIKRRGAILTLIGLLIPAFLFFLYV